LGRGRGEGDSLPVDDETKAKLRDPKHLDQVLDAMPVGPASHLHACTHTTLPVRSFTLACACAGHVVLPFVYLCWRRRRAFFLRTCLVLNLCMHAYCCCVSLYIQTHHFQNLTVDDMYA